MEHTAQRPDKGAIEQAAAWFARTQSPNATEATRSALESWLNSSTQNRAAYDEVLRMWGAAPGLLAALEPLEQAQGPSRGAAGWLPRFTKIAAALLVAGGMGTVLYSLNRNETPRVASVVAAATQESTYTTGANNRSGFALPDGSLVVLNPDSEIHVAYSSNARSIRLVHGQALFEVAKHRPQPFYVLAGDRRVMATGTAFDVKLSDEKSVEVTLVEGSVVVERPATGPAHAVRMHAGERLLARAGMEPQIAPTNFDDVTNWRTERLTFYETPLSTVVATLNRYGGPVIFLGSARLGELKVDGTLRTNDPVAAAHAIAKIYGLRFSRPHQTVLLSE